MSIIRRPRSNLSRRGDNLHLSTPCLCAPSSNLMQLAISAAATALSANDPYVGKSRASMNMMDSWSHLQLLTQLEQEEEGYKYCKATTIDMLKSESSSSPCPGHNLISDDTHAIAEDRCRSSVNHEVFRNFSDRVVDQSHRRPTRERKQHVFSSSTSTSPHTWKLRRTSSTHLEQLESSAMNWQSRPQLLTTLSHVGNTQASWRDAVSFGYRPVGKMSSETEMNSLLESNARGGGDSKIATLGLTSSGVNMAFEEGPLSSDIWSNQLVGRDLILALTQRDQIPVSPAADKCAVHHSGSVSSKCTSTGGAAAAVAANAQQDLPTVDMLSDSHSIILEPQLFTYGYDNKIFDITKVAAYDFATQITLLFLQVFKAIQMEELTSMGWIGKDKSQRAPNVVEFTKLFNNINFWVQEECLKERNLPRRAEVLSHFVKIAKELMKLNNIHGTMAVLAALQSEPIYRLKRTWALLGHRQQTYDKLCQIFNQDDNRIHLRKYMEQVKLPVIPYLGMYTSDLVYIDTMYPSTGGLESQPRQDQINNLLRTLAEFQHSEYNIPVKHYLREYLQQKRYIEELQTFLDKENHDTSLRLEPDHQHRDALDASVTPNLEISGSGAIASSSIQRRVGDDVVSGAAFSVENNGSSVQMRQHPTERSFTPGHRKSKSLGNVVCTPPSQVDLASGLGGVSGVPPRNLVDDTPLNQDAMLIGSSCSAEADIEEALRSKLHLGKCCSPDIIATVPRQRFNHGRSMLSTVSPSPILSASPNANQHCNDTSNVTSSTLLVRTSIVDNGGTSSGTSKSKSEDLFTSTPRSSTTEMVLAAAMRGSVQLSAAASLRLAQRLSSVPFICEGCVRRKTVMRAGRHTRAAMYSRFWLSLVWQEPYPLLLYFNAKSWSGSLRTDFKRSPSKVQNISDCLVLHDVIPPTFQLVSVATGNTYKFRLSEAVGQPTLDYWVMQMEKLIKKAKEPKDLISFEPVFVPSLQTEDTSL